MNFLSFEIDEEFEEYQQTWYFLQISLIRKQPDKDIIKWVSNISFKTELEQYENMIQLLDDTQGCMISTQDNFTLTRIALPVRGSLCKHI